MQVHIPLGPNLGSGRQIVDLHRCGEHLCGNIVNALGPKGPVLSILILKLAIETVLIHVLVGKKARTGES